MTFDCSWWLAAKAIQSFHDFDRPRRQQVVVIGNDIKCNKQTTKNTTLMVLVNMALSLQRG
jgi:hypothetical protein